MITQLKLTDDQRKAMDGILLQHREQLIDLQGTLQKAELELQPLMNLLDIRAKLTPDQWKQLQDLRTNGLQRPQPGGQGQGQGPQRQYRRGQGGGQGNPPPPPDGTQAAPAPAPGTGGEL
jgi:hypothetical protein